MIKDNDLICVLGKMIALVAKDANNNRVYLSTNTMLFTDECDPQYEVADKSIMKQLKTLLNLPRVPTRIMVENMDWIHDKPTKDCRIYIFVGETTFAKLIGQ